MELVSIGKFLWSREERENRFEIIFNKDKGKRKTRINEKDFIRICKVKVNLSLCLIN
jgi:hypothetical protein